MTLLTTIIVLALFYGSGALIYEPVCSVDDGRYDPEYSTFEDCDNNVVDESGLIIIEYTDEIG